MNTILHSYKKRL